LEILVNVSDVVEMCICWTGF